MELDCKCTLPPQGHRRMSRHDLPGDGFGLKRSIWSQRRGKRCTNAPRRSARLAPQAARCAGHASRPWIRPVARLSGGPRPDIGQGIVRTQRAPGRPRQMPVRLLRPHDLHRAGARRAAHRRDTTEPRGEPELVSQVRHRFAHPPPTWSDPRRDSRPRVTTGDADRARCRYTPDAPARGQEHQTRPNTASLRRARHRRHPDSHGHRIGRQSHAAPRCSDAPSAPITLL